MEEIWQSIRSSAASAGLRLLGAVAILVIGLKMVSFLCKQIGKGKGFGKLDKSLQTFLLSFLKILLNIVVIVSAAMLLGVPTTSFVTLLASAGVAIGLALQGSLSNFAGGLMLMFFKPFAVDDYIEVAGVSGTVHDITPFYTVIVTLDGRRITLPNGTITNTNITNYSVEQMRRVEIRVDVAYGTDIEQVKRLLCDVAAAHPLVLHDQPVFARMTGMGESALNFLLRVCVHGTEYWNAYYSLTEQVAQTLQQQGIEIPFPQLTIHQANETNNSEE